MRDCQIKDGREISEKKETTTKEDRRFLTHDIARDVNRCSDARSLHIKHEQKKKKYIYISLLIETINRSN